MGLSDPVPESDREVAESGWKLMRSALRQLAADASAQRRVLAGSVVADELALDFDHAFAVLAGAGALGRCLDEVALARLQELDGVLEEHMHWGHADLGVNPVWVRARELARHLLLAVGDSSCS